MRKPTVESVLSCAGVAGLILIVDWHERSLPLQGVYFAYFANEPTVGKVLEGLFTTFALAGVLWVLFQRALRWRPLYRDCLAVMLASLILVAARDLLDRFYIIDPAESWGASVRSCMLAAVLGAAALRRLLRRDPLIVLQTVGVLTAAVPLMVTGGLLLQMRSTPRPPADRANASKPPSRAIILIFDELDYDHVYGDRKRAPLPNFEALREEGFVAVKAMTPGRMTSLAIASYLTGETIVEFELAKGKEATARTLAGEQKELANFPNLFTDAKQAGFHVAAGGAFQNYCRTFGRYIDDCFRVSDVSWPLREVWFPSGPIEMNGVRFHAADRHHKGAVRMYRDVVQWLSQAITKGEGDLVYAHLSVPHQPYLAWTDATSPSDEERRGNYARNVLLVDKTVGWVRRWVKESARAAETILIVTSDHPLRSQLVGESVEQWKSRVRVPFVVQGPGVPKGVRYEPAFSTAALRELTTGLMNRKIASLPTWLNQRRQKDLSFIRSAYPRFAKSCLNYVIEGDKQSRYTLISRVLPNCD